MSGIGKEEWHGRGRASRVGRVRIRGRDKGERWVGLGTGTGEGVGGGVGGGVQERSGIGMNEGYG